MKKYFLILFIALFSFALAQDSDTNSVEKGKKSYKVTIYYPEKKTYQNVSDLDYDFYYNRSKDQLFSSRIIEFYEQPNSRHVIIGDGWIAEENFK